LIFSDLGGKVVKPAPGGQIDFSDLGGKLVSSNDSGMMRNDVGNQVIVPKQWGGDDEEPFQATVQRAINYQKSQTPQERSSAIAKETATIPDKTAQTLAGAAIAGTSGPSALMVAGQGVLAAGGVGVTTAAWLKAHPVQALVVYHLARELGIPLPKAVDVISKFGAGE
jgi:hypothetical protein